MMKAKHAGFTLIEGLVTIAVIGLLASIAIPAFTSFLDKYRLRGVTDILSGDLQWARMEAVRNNQKVYVNFSTGSNWCYGMNMNTTCSCATAGSCTLKQVSAADYKDVTLTSSSFTTDPYFDPQRGLASSSGAATFQSLQGKQAEVTISLLGMLNVCTPTGAASAGYPAC